MDEEKFLHAKQLLGRIKVLDAEQRSVANGDLREFLEDNPRFYQHPAAHEFAKSVALTIAEEIEPLKKEFESL